MRAPLRAPAVSGGRVDAHARVGEPLKDLLVQCRRVATEIPVRHEGHGHDVGFDDHRVIQGCQQVGVARARRPIGDDLRDDELSLRGCATIRRPVRCRERRHTSSMRVQRIVLGPVVVAAGQIRVAIGVVVGEGNLVTDPRAAPPGVQLGAERGALPLRQVQRRGVHAPREGLVRGVEAGVDDLDNAAPTRAGDLVGARLFRRIGDWRVRGH